MTAPIPAPVLTARNAVALSFALNGFAFASWISRVPQTRNVLDLTNGGLGLLLLCLSVTSVLGLPASGPLVQRFGAATVVRLGTAGVVVGLALIVLGVGLLGSFVVTGAGLAAYGFGTAVWDVAMNVEGAEVERRLGRTIMPRFHAAFSLGTVLAAGVGAATIALHVPIVLHLGGVLLLTGTLSHLCAGRFLTAGGDANPAGSSPTSWQAWREPRTLLIGLMVLALALTEGVANDWLALALVDGYDVEEWVGVLGFAGFVIAMTAGRLIGPSLLDHYGRVPVLWGTMAAATAGVLLIVFGGGPWLVVPGILLWGAGASLGFPVGMSAAADDPAGAAARVAVVSTVGYTAFLAGPPLLGFVGDHVGTLKALLVVAVLLIPSALVVPAARERS